MRGSQPAIAILGSNRNFANEHRIRNEVALFSGEYAVDGYGTGTVAGLRAFHAVQGPPRMLYRIVKLAGGLFPGFRIGFETAFHRRLAMQIRAQGYRFVIAHNIVDALSASAAGVPYLFNSNEYLPRQFDASRWFRLTEVRYRKRALKRILSGSVLNIVEGDAVLAAYATEFGLPADRFVVMPNMPAYRQPGEPVRRAAESATIKLIHHGNLVPERGIELLVDIAAALGRGFHLTLMGPGGPAAYLERLRARARDAGNVTLAPPVPYEQILEAVSSFDIGLVVFGSPHYHHRYMTVPNKFWECLQARVPVVVSPDSAMAAIVRESGCGVVAASATLDGYVQAVRALDEERIAALKARCEQHAWTHSRDAWFDAYRASIERAVASACPPVRTCARCVMDTTAPDIQFDADGVCNYCTDFLAAAGPVLAEDPRARRARLDAFVRRVQRAGRGKPYDCVVGVSGGIDSAWVLVKAVELGLRPLAVHMDNGWDSELAQNNIGNLVRNLGVDLHTHVIDWVEYRALMQAFLDADVIDIEVLYDNAMLRVNYAAAAAHGVRYILSGSNLVTEGIRLPEWWVWLKTDARNIRAIGKRNGVRLKTFPALSTMGLLWYRMARRITMVPLLNMLDYEKERALTELEADHGYKRYPYKHYESVFTRFYQGYILPTKFGVDKRRVHLSTLVMTGQMPRAEALRHFETIPYPSDDALQQDRAYFLKKMGWTPAQLDAYLARPAVPHDAYPSEQRLWDAVVSIRKMMGHGR